MDSQHTSWAEWNRRGFIPGPDESRELFLERIAFCQNLKKHLANDPAFPFSLKEEGQEGEEILKQALPLTRSLYGIAPDWVPLVFSNAGLAPWHGGCAWIFRLKKTSPLAALLQLRKAFALNRTLFGFYDRCELIVHELAHAGRMAYSEPQFEEFFAYASSQSRWRCTFGPIVASAAESLLFVFVLVALLTVDIASLFLGLALPIWLEILRFSPIILIGWAAGRLFFRHKMLHKAHESLKKGLSDEQARHLLYRLTDREIREFSALSFEHIQAWVNDQALRSFRWKFLQTIYLTPSNTKTDVLSQNKF